MKKLLIIFIACLSTLAYADQAQNTYHNIELPLSIRSIDCVSNGRAFKITLSLWEAKVTPDFDLPGIKNANVHTLFSSGPIDKGSFTTQKKCDSVATDLLRRYPDGVNFSIQRTIEVSWRSGCPNDRCPQKKEITISAFGFFDEIRYSSNKYD